MMRVCTAYNRRRQVGVFRRRTTVAVSNAGTAVRSACCARAARAAGGVALWLWGAGPWPRRAAVPLCLLAVAGAAAPQGTRTLDREQQPSASLP